MNWIIFCQVPSEWASEYSTTLHADGLETSSIGIQFSLEPTHFRKGGSVLRLKCLATFAKMHSLANEAQIFRQRTEQLEEPNNRLEEQLPEISENLSQGKFEIERSSSKFNNFRIFYILKITDKEIKFYFIFMLCCYAICLNF